MDGGRVAHGNFLAGKNEQNQNQMWQLVLNNPRGSRPRSVPRGESSFTQLCDVDVQLTMIHGKRHKFLKELN